MTETPENSDRQEQPPEEPRARVRAQPFSLVWLFPIGAVALVGWLAWRSLADLVADRQGRPPSEVAEERLLSDHVEEALQSLTTRERLVLKMRFGIDDGSERTLEEVGQSFAVTRERIRQIESKALRKLRHPSRSRKLKAFLEGPAF